MITSRIHKSQNQEYQDTHETWGANQGGESPEDPPPPPPPHQEENEEETPWPGDEQDRDTPQDEEGEYVRRQNWGAGVLAYRYNQQIPFEGLSGVDPYILVITDRKGTDGFPKGAMKRKGLYRKKEAPKVCSLREFQEESNLQTKYLHFSEEGLRINCRYGKPPQKDRDYAPKGRMVTKYTYVECKGVMYFCAIYAVANGDMREASEDALAWPVHDRGDDVVRARWVPLSSAVNDNHPVDLPDHRREVAQMGWETLSKHRETIDAAWRKVYGHPEQSRDTEVVQSAGTEGAATASASNAIHQILQLFDGEIGDEVQR